MQTLISSKSLEIFALFRLIFKVLFFLPIFPDMMQTHLSCIYEKRFGTYLYKSFSWQELCNKLKDWTHYLKNKSPSTLHSAAYTNNPRIFGGINYLEKFIMYFSKSCTIYALFLVKKIVFSSCIAHSTKSFVLLLDSLEYEECETLIKMQLNHSPWSIIWIRGISRISIWLHFMP